MDSEATVTYAQYNEDLILLALFPDIKEGFYVDVGANDPVIDSVTKLFYDKGWNGINIEPIKGLHRKLAESRPRDINLQCGVGEESGEATLREYKSTSGHSTFDDKQKKKHGNADKYEDYDVSIRTLKNIFEEYTPQRRVHFAKIDVEGFEYSVIKGNDWQKYRPEVVCVEANHITRDWRTILTDNDYWFFIADGLNEYYVAKESWKRTEDFAERIIKLDYRALKLHQMRSWNKNHAELVRLHKTAKDQDGYIKSLEGRLKGLEKELAALAPLSLKNLTLRSRIKRAAYGLTVDWIKFKRGK